MCDHCGKPAVVQCVRCKAAFYCRRKCQKFHWSRGGHKPACIAAAAAFKATFNDPAASEQLRAIAYQRLTAQGPQAMAAAAVLEADRGPPSPSCTCPTARRARDRPAS